MHTTTGKTENDIADRLYTAAQVRALDACAIKSFAIPGYELMQRAGQAVFEQTVRRFPEKSSWLIFCGAGNNGGDGYVLAKIATQAGLSVQVLALSPIERLTGDAACAAGDWRDAGGAISDFAEFDFGNAQAELVVDAMLGTGLDRPVSGAYKVAIDWINDCDFPVVSVDIPSGLYADTGVVAGSAVEADLTISFIGQKRGLFTGAGQDHSGALVFTDLSVPSEVYKTQNNYGKIIHEQILLNNLKARQYNSFKGSYGHVLVVGGQAGMSGAARLCAEAALRTGAGLVSVITDASHAALLNIGRPELMVYGATEGLDWDAAFARADVIAVGPGLGTSSVSAEWLNRCLRFGKPVLLDADALNLLADPAFRRNTQLPVRCVITPHPGEAARLLGVSTDAIQADRVTAALELAKRYDVVAVLKGSGTVVADQKGGYAICPLGNPGMATAGSGDVLSGIAAAFMGEGQSPWDAGVNAVVAHALAGDRAADRLGQRGMLATDLITELPGVLRAVHSDTLQEK